MIKEEVEVAGTRIKKAVTYVYDCASEFDQRTARVLGIKEYNEKGNLLNVQEFFHTGTSKNQTTYSYDQHGNVVSQQIHDPKGNLTRKRYFNKLGYDTLVSNYLADGTPQTTLQKFLSYTPEGFVQTVKIMDEMGRTHSVLSLEYRDTLLLEETFTSYNLLSGNPLGTEVIRYNEKGDRAYMSTASGSGETIDDEVSMEYRYHQNGKIENARLYNKDGLLIREKNNTFYSNGNVKSIVDNHYDPLEGTVTQTYEELYLENGKIGSYSLKDANGGVRRSGEYTYNDKGLLLEAIEFDPGQTPAYLCTRLAYEFYN